jgi:predicted O-linked N-acetylglucosamine transferase (SPINDLY family)
MDVAVNALPAAETGWVTFASLNNYSKVNEPLLKLWARVLAAVANSHLLLLSPLGRHRQRVLEIMRTEGVRAERVEFVVESPRQDYLERYHHADVMLDSFPYNGHTTSLDALWMGVPVVSLVGEEVVSRAGLSQLSNLGLPELVAFSEKDYVRIAAQLAGDLSRLAQLRETLRARMEASVLMDGERFARGIEGAYRAMWRDWCEREVRR